MICSSLFALVGVVTLIGVVTALPPPGNTLERGTLPLNSTNVAVVASPFVSASAFVSAPDQILSVRESTDFAESSPVSVTVSSEALYQPVMTTGYLDTSTLATSVSTSTTVLYQTMVPSGYEVASSTTSYDPATTSVDEGFEGLSDLEEQKYECIQTHYSKAKAEAWKAQLVRDREFYHNGGVSDGSGSADGLEDNKDVVEKQDQDRIDEEHEKETEYCKKHRHHHRCHKHRHHPKHGHHYDDWDGCL